MRSSPDSELDSATAPSAPQLRALVVLDLADSTALVDRLGDARAAELMRRHDRMARELMRRHDGREIDKSDGFLVLFERAAQAVVFALGYQRALRGLASQQQLPLAARLGIHVGEVVLWENSPQEVARGARALNVEGLAKPVAARLMALALPGQVLLSGVAQDLAMRAEAELREAGLAPLWKAHGDFHLKGIAEPVRVHEVGEPGIAPLRAPRGSDKARRVFPWWRRPFAIGAQLLLALVVLVLVWVALKPQPGIAFGPRDWVILGHFANRTGQPMLDGALDLAFRQGLAQSRHVNVLGTLAVQDALKRMRLDPARTAIDRGVGSEIALRESARALLLPAVGEHAGRLRVAVEVVDPSSQATVWVASEFADGQAGLLDALDRLIASVRDQLGESLQSIEATSVPLQQATTPDLDALHLYSSGFRLYEELKYDEARRLFERAIEIDPEFAMAHAGIASTYLPVGRFAEGIPAARRAAALRERLSARERMYVDALLAWSEDPRLGAERWQDFAHVYPDSGAGQNNAALTLWQDLNRCPQALPLFDEAYHSRDPKRFTSAHGKGYCQLWSGDAAAALQSFADAQALNPLAITRGVADAHTLLEQFAQAERALDAQLPPTPPRFALEGDARRVTWLAYQGRLREALAAAEVFARKAADADVPSAQARAALYAQALRLHLGEPLALQALADSELERLGPGESPHYPASLHLAAIALLAARAGEPEHAQAWLDALRTPRPLSRPSPALDAILMALEARLRADGETSAALLRGLQDEHAYLQQRLAAADLALAAGDRSAALAHLRWIEANRGRAFGEFYAIFALQVLNVLDVNQSLLRQVALEPDAAVREQLRERLRQRWQAAEPQLLAAAVASGRAD